MNPFKHKSITQKWNDILDQVRARATMMDSPLHGDTHWRAVALAGMRICDLFPACDRDVVLAFAMYHDSQRLNDDSDPDHGMRAAAEVRTSSDLKRILDGDQIKKLAKACDLHDKGGTSEDPTIGACWDADRANLWRVSVTPHIRFFSMLSGPDHFADITGRMEQDWFNPPTWEILISQME